MAIAADDIRATLSERRREQGELLKQMHDITESARAEGRELTDDETAKLEAMDQRADRVEAAIQRDRRNHERALELERWADAEPRRTEPDDVPQRGRSAASVVESDEYREAFGDWVGMGRGAAEGELSKRFNTSDIGSEGGFLVPQKLQAGYYARLAEEVVMRRIARVFTNVGYGGLGTFGLETGFDAADSLADNATAQTSTGERLGHRELSPKRIAKKARLPEKAMGTPAAVDLLLDELLAIHGEEEERQFMVGNGRDEALGIFTASDSGIPTTRDVVSNNTATAISENGLIAAYMSVKPQGRRRGTWVMSTETLQNIMQIKDDDGRRKFAGADGGPPQTLMARPIEESTLAPGTLSANQYAAVFGDFRRYYIADAVGVSVRQKPEEGMDEGLVVWLGTVYVDGMPVSKGGEHFARVKMGS